MDLFKAALAPRLDLLTAENSSHRFISSFAFHGGAGSYHGHVGVGGVGGGLRMSSRTFSAAAGDSSHSLAVFYFWKFYRDI